VRLLFPLVELCVAQFLPPPKFAQDHHIGIAPVAGPREPGGFGGCQGVVEHAGPRIVNVPACAPKIALNIRVGRPLPDVCFAVLANGVDHITAAVINGLAHETIGAHKHLRTLAVGHAAVGAPVIFEEVHSPRSEGPGILKFMFIAAFVSGAGCAARGCVDARFQPRVVEVSDEAGHVRELVVGDDGAVGLASTGPSVIDAHVLEPVVGKA